MRSWKKSWELLSGRRREEAGGIDHGAVAEYSRISQRLCGEQAQNVVPDRAEASLDARLVKGEIQKRSRGRSWSSFGSRDFS